MNFFEIFQYGFIVRALEAGIIVACITPLIGIFLVLRRYSLIADTLAHVSLAGVALGFLAGLNPILTALGVTVLSSLGVERLRTTGRVYGESALAIFLSGSLALAVVLLSLGKGFSSNLLNYLFGSIVTVTQNDIYIIATLAVFVIAAILIFFKELLYISFDEESARVSGIPVGWINTMLIILTAITIALSIPIVGVLLIAALIVIPVVTALQLRQSFLRTILFAEGFSILSVIIGIIISFYFNLSTGGTIVLISLAFFLVVLFFCPASKTKFLFPEARTARHSSPQPPPAAPSEHRIEPAALPRNFTGRTPKENTLSFFKRNSPPPNQKCKECFLSGLPTSPRGGVRRNPERKS
jgi:zinc transport system permease protein